MPLLVSNSNDIVIRNMRTASSGAAITDAILTCVITDPNDAQIASFSMSHEGSGDYRGTTTAQLTHGISYLVDVTASNYTFRRTKTIKAIDPAV